MRKRSRLSSNLLGKTLYSPLNSPLNSPVGKREKKKTNGNSTYFNYSVDEIIRGQEIPPIVQGALDKLIDLAESAGSSWVVKAVFLKNLQEVEALDINKLALENGSVTIESIPNPQVVAGLLMLFFSQMAEKLLSEVSDFMINSIGITDQEWKLMHFHNILNQIPKKKKILFYYLLDQLDKLSCIGAQEYDKSLAHLCSCFGHILIEGSIPDNSKDELVSSKDFKKNNYESNILYYIMTNKDILRGEKLNGATFTSDKGTFSLQTISKDKFIDYLISSSHIDTGFQYCIFTTISYVMTEAELLQEIITHRLNITGDSVWEIIKVKMILQTLEDWIDYSLNDLSRNKEFIGTLEGFIDNPILLTEEKSQIHILVNNLKNNTREYKKKYHIGIELNEDIKKTLEDSFFGEENERHFAQNITILGNKILRSIPVNECLHENYADPQSNTNVMIRHCNELFYWVQTMILREETSKDRADRLSFFLKVAMNCMEFKNYNTAWTIYTATESVAISRLALTWKECKKGKKIKEKLGTIFSVSKNYSNYYTIMRLAQLPAIPCIEMITKTFFMIDEGNPTYVGDHINAEKLMMLFDTVEFICKYQNDKYNFAKDKTWMAYMFNLTFLNENELYELSLEREPRV
eukprot:TRINITY_DN5344_c0_g1_i1.p1 TRINITY_DN5344_c0_g1~~TRINITY_DN5344_c0_g1_i1.p1  ORF type:complete len:635 (-),score=128.94 TRINITY_DN5344_c0_g1_i1:38-1942(-)